MTVHEQEILDEIKAAGYDPGKIAYLSAMDEVLEKRLRLTERDNWRTAYYKGYLMGWFMKSRMPDKQESSL
jgi:hypothetical protein